MDILISICNAAKTLDGLYTSAKINAIIKELQNNISEVYLDFIEIDLASAESAILAGQTSNDSERQIFAAINYLQHAFFTCEKALSKKRSYLFFLEKPFLNREQRNRAVIFMFEIAICIYIYYKGKNEFTNCEQWKQKCCKYLDLYIEEKIYFLSPEYIYHHINNQYIHCWRDERYYGDGVTGYKTIYELNGKGRLYLKQTKKKLLDTANDILELH